MNYKCSIISLVFGAIGIIGGIVTVVFYSDLYHYIMKKQLAVTWDSYSFGLWEETPIPMHMNIYYFNVTNAEEVMDDLKTMIGSERVKPRLKQVGPYSFDEYHKKTNISFSPDGNLVDFYQMKYWIFNPERSNGDLSDEIWTLNMIAVAAAESTRWPDKWAEDDYPFMQVMLGTSIQKSNETMFLKTAISNLTFDGIDSPLLHMGDIGGDLGTAINNSIPFDRFGWFYSRNESIEYDGLFQMHTGKDDIYKVGQISAWQGSPDMSEFYPEPCHGLYGSAGEFFPQDRDKTDISYFTPDLCRPISFKFKEKTKVSGISGYKYWLDEGFVANSTFNETNWCYNDEPDIVPDYYDQSPRPLLGEKIPNMHLPNGLLNVSKCKYDSAAYVSFPHFYMADPILLEQFHPESDLHPNEEEHSSYLSIMPQQGIPLEVAIRMQINVLYRPLPHVDMLANVSPTFYPAVWFEVLTELPHDMVVQLRLLEWVPKFGDIFGGITIGVGAILAAVGGIWMFRNKGAYV